ncbi:MAG: hypothetical protein M3N05_06025 [Pseudomonadota bacterium]|nr:hypothetical protein [Pseudomonadota bacterium]
MSQFASHASGYRRPIVGPTFLIAAALALLPGAAMAAQLVTPDGPAAPVKSVMKLPHFNAYSVRGGAPRGTVDGMGLYATARGSAVDLTAPDHMLEGPSGSLFNQAAGFGWRNHNVSAMVGYMKPSSVRSATGFTDASVPRFKSSARFGLGWAMHF